MNRKIFLDALKNIFADVFADENIKLTEETSAYDIEAWDSLAHITILEAVQDEYGIIFGLDEMIQMESIGDMIDAVMDKLNKKDI